MEMQLWKCGLGTSMFSLPDRPVDNNCSSVVDYQWSCFMGEGKGGGGGGGHGEHLCGVEAFAIVFVGNVVKVVVFVFETVR